VSTRSILTVPNWSFGRDRELLRTFQEVLGAADVNVHYCEADIDHNRTVTAFSGASDEVADLILQLAREAFPRIDLNRHVGVHPRIGALDVCPFVLLPGFDDEEAMASAQACVERVAKALADEHGVPVYLYEKSERGRHEADLPSLRKGGFGGLTDRVLNPDYGPTKAHPRLGVSVVGVRDFLIAFNVNLSSVEVSVAKTLAAQIRNLRQAGDERFLGVRALGLLLASRHLTQVSMNVTLPDLVDLDPIIEWIEEEAGRRGVQIADVELIGVIRQDDLLGATRVPYKRAQVV
jgi:glutamate formiminotransferase